MTRTDWRGRLVVAVLGLASIFAVATPSSALGDFSNGKEVLRLGSYVRQVLPYPGSRLLLLCGDGNPADLDFLVRLRKDGSVDRSFGDNGLEGIPAAREVLVEGNGEIVVLPSSGAALIRLHADGKRTPSYEGSISFGKLRSVGTAIAKAPDGKLWIAGTTASSYGPGIESEEISVVGRLLPNGRPDRTFGGGDGLVTVSDIPELPVVSLASTPEGGVLAETEEPANEAPNGVVRLRRDGAIETSFGEGGRIPIAVRGGFLSEDEEGFFATPGLGMLPGGDFLFAGTARLGLSYVGIASKRLPDGALDTSYAKQGYARAAIPNWFFVKDFVVQADGSLVLAGQVHQLNDESHETSELAAARLDPNGHLDRSFGHLGTAMLHFKGWGGWENLDGMALLPPGRVVLVGSSRGEGGHPLTHIARLPLIHR